MNMFVWPFNGTSNILKLHIRDSIIFTEILEVMNSNPNLLNVTVAFFLLKKCIVALLIKNNTPVWDLYVTLFPVRYASTKQCVVTESPLSSGVPFKIDSLTSL